MNKAILIGNIGRDPETRTFANGGSVVGFSLATTESWKDKSTGERKERTEWHNISVFNENLGRIVSAFCRKGSKIYIEGSIHTREYTDKDGNQRKSTEIHIPQYGGAIELLDPKKSDAVPPSRAAKLSEEFDDIIPFG